MQNLLPEILQDELDAREISAPEFVRRMGAMVDEISIVLRGDAGISTELAEKLSCLFGTSANVWVNLSEMNGGLTLAILENIDGRQNFLRNFLKAWSKWEKPHVANAHRLV